MESLVECNVEVCLLGITGLFRPCYEDFLMGDYERQLIYHRGAAHAQLLNSKCSKRRAGAHTRVVRNKNAKQKMGYILHKSTSDAKPWINQQNVKKTRNAKGYRM
jgi:hypothetical protein